MLCTCPSIPLKLWQAVCLRKSEFKQTTTCMSANIKHQASMQRNNASICSTDNWDTFPLLPVATGV